VNVPVKTALLKWACERNGLAVDAFEHRFRHLARWVSGASYPTMKQLEDFAKATHTPIGYFFLDAPPVEKMPIPDFRTMGKVRDKHPSPNLLDTIYLCQQRQEWYRNFVLVSGGQPLGFVGSVRTSDDVVVTAARIRDTLGFGVSIRAEFKTWADALRYFIGQAEEAGLLVMCTGVVQNNNRRHLDPEEFRGFALADPLASVVFINGADSKSAQMFTLAHELSHIWLGQSGVTDSLTLGEHPPDVERWCDAVAAELLVPMVDFRLHYDPKQNASAQLQPLVRRYKVSSLVVLRRMFDLGALSQSQFWTLFREELERLKDKPASSGGNFYLAQPVRASKRFAQAIIASTWEGRSSFTEAFKLLGVSKMTTFRHLSETFGMSL
jgi:Zn-dependent peptidase ImmA (M78 family)